eukprot:TRINITY_DN111_c0_g1_i15.p1 TRINITY_DN111_c0_g1~~TRINITY_DN111_c0_g1_i15.p1  ORF type:complete len:768 (+),score=203.42 TRINITY_DN111_c0_g1_i15:64-2367(+)
MSLKTSTLGFPRTGPKREMKIALEKYWSGAISADELITTSDSIAVKSYEEQLSRGVDFIGVGDHTLYDHILDWSERFGLTCTRVKAAKLTGLDAYFTQARGRDGIHALDMTKYFDSNYHYMVPEVPDDVTPTGDFKEFIRQIKLGQQTVGKEKTVPIIVGPLTLSKLCKPCGDLSSDELLTRLLPCYEQLLKELQQIGVSEVQFHEPWFVKSEAVNLKDVASALYGKGSALTSSKSGISVNLCIHFDSLHVDVYKYIITLDVERITLDFCRGSSMLSILEREGFPNNKQLGAGIVDGRNVWKSEESAAKLLTRIRKLVADDNKVVVSPSCSLQFIPYDLSLEKDLPSDVREQLAFAVQKLDVLVKLASSSSATSTSTIKSNGDYEWVGEDNTSGADDISKATKVGEVTVTADMFSRSEAFDVRREKQVSVPRFPTTTIGSFPQTPELRRNRLAWKQKKLSEADYQQVIDAELKKNIDIQTDIGLDIFVHGEPERSDMVEHFGQRLEGFSFTNHGWVQSYGSRYVRPPIICGPVSRREPMTVREFKVAQEMTDRPVKGMLTGPVTILNWSFCRVDTPRWKQALEVALAIREEVADLEAAGCRVIQVDEAALRERMPLKDEEAASYMSWAVKSFRLSTAVAKSSTQIVTHMCYSTFEDIIDKIDEMDADVLTIENSRSGNEMLSALSGFGYNRDIGPGVYDIHSPVIPSKDELIEQVRNLAQSGLPLDRIWVNPDCGLKTRKWNEVIPSLKNMVAAAKVLRDETAPRMG